MVITEFDAGIKDVIDEKGDYKILYIRVKDDLGHEGFFDAPLYFENPNDTEKITYDIYRIKLITEQFKGIRKAFLRALNHAEAAWPGTIYPLPLTPKPGQLRILKGIYEDYVVYKVEVYVNRWLTNSGVGHWVNITHISPSQREDLRLKDGTLQLKSYYKNHKEAKEVYDSIYEIPDDVINKMQWSEVCP